MSSTPPARDRDPGGLPGGPVPPGGAKDREDRAPAGGGDREDRAPAGGGAKDREDREPAGGGQRNASQDGSVPADGAGGSPRWNRKLISRLWRNEKLRSSVSLTLVGIAILLGAYGVYNSRATEISSPRYVRFAVTAPIPLSTITYSARQISPTTANVTIELFSWQSPQTGPGIPELMVQPPLGTTLLECGNACKTTTYYHYITSTWTMALTEKSSSKNLGNVSARAQFQIHTRNFNTTVNFNGVTASAAIPEVTYKGRGNPTILTIYDFPSAESYDWSSFPPVARYPDEAQWQEVKATEVTPSRLAVGTNNDGKSYDDFKLFIAGALVGIGGGALVAAFQEALHDGKTQRNPDQH